MFYRGFTCTYFSSQAEKAFKIIGQSRAAPTPSRTGTVPRARASTATPAVIAAGSRLRRAVIESDEDEDEEDEEDKEEEEEIAPKRGKRSAGEAV